jgi:hypothetical protein
MFPKHLFVWFCLFGVSVSGWRLNSFLSSRDDPNEEIQPQLDFPPGLGDYIQENFLNGDKIAAVSANASFIEDLPVVDSFHPIYDLKTPAHKFLMGMKKDEHVSDPVSVPLYSAEEKLLELIFKLQEFKLQEALRNDVKDLTEQLKIAKDLTEQLKIGLEHEGFFDDHFPSVEMVNEAFECIQTNSSAAFTKGDPFFDLLAAIRPLDNSFLLKSLSRSVEVEELLANQTVIFLIGKSGSGKSLAMHYFGNSTFQIQVINGTEKVIPNIFDEQLFKIKVGVITGKSETLEVRALKIAIPNTNPVEYVFFFTFATLPVSLIVVIP